MADYKSVKDKVSKQPKKGKRWTEQTRRSSSRSSGGCAVGYIKKVGGKRHGKCVKAGGGHAKKTITKYQQKRRIENRADDYKAAKKGQKQARASKGKRG